MPIKQDNTFAIKSTVNLDNASSALEYLKNNNESFANNKLNQTLIALYTLLQNPSNTKSTVLKAPNNNKEFNDLIERYIHISPYDPCSYIHEVRDLLFAGTNTVELDITAEAVYIFAKYISKDDELLDAYTSGDIYTILYKVSRDKQKTMMNTWIQGYYIDDLPYNKLFPKTAEYLKRTAIKDNHIYARNSGLFRDIETNKLIAICKKCDRKITNHLHDAVYTTEKHFNEIAKCYHEEYGNELKFKRKDYKHLTCNIDEYLGSRNWSSKDMLSADQMELVYNYRDKLVIWKEPNGEYKYNCWNAPSDLSKETLQSIIAYRIASSDPSRTVI